MNKHLLKIILQYINTRRSFHKELLKKTFYLRYDSNHWYVYDNVSCINNIRCSESYEIFTKKQTYHSRYKYNHNKSMNRWEWINK
jgi:hypothetical protein